MSAFSGLAGALLAGLAILYAARQSVNAKRDLIRERRVEFELALLADIRRQMSITGLAHLAGQIGALVTDEQDESELQVLRAATGIKGTKSGARARDSVADTSSPNAQAAWVRVAEAEVDAAIKSRLLRNS